VTEPWSPGLEVFCIWLNANAGQYAIVARRRRELEALARAILEACPGVVIHWGQMNILFPSGAVAYLIPVRPRGEEQFYGLRLDGAWFISGGEDELYLSESLKVFVASRSARPEFTTWQTYL
jgi:hypothetical protein